MKLPVLMYDKVDDDVTPDYLTVSTKQLKKQFEYLNKNNFTCILFSDLIRYVRNEKKLPPKPVLLTFDDGYENNYTNLYPLLLEFNCKANIFLVSDFVETENIQISENKHLSVSDIKKMKSDIIEFGLHTVNHKSYNDLTIQEIDEDLKKSQLKFKTLSIPFQPCFAYTYGAYPKKDEQKRTEIFKCLQNNNVELAFKIGNRVNKLPLKNAYLIQRIDIRGDESFLMFKIGLHFGKKILFK
jgi:peptidoglycan/xylan/chitin deacetylase (PgdA/CDA1 family)